MTSYLACPMGSPGRPGNRATYRSARPMRSRARRWLKYGATPAATTAIVASGRVFRSIVSAATRLSRGAPLPDASCRNCLGPLTPAWKRTLEATATRTAARAAIESRQTATAPAAPSPSSDEHGNEVREEARQTVHIGAHIADVEHAGHEARRRAGQPSSCPRTRQTPATAMAGSPLRSARRSPSDRPRRTSSARSRPRP